MPQYGFFFDQGRCTGCQNCMLSCKEWNGIPPGPVRWMRVYQWETSAFPNTRIYALAVPCYHCENPVCVDAANGAMYKEGKYGAVLIDPAKATSIDLRKANDACPYGAIVFESDDMGAKASKCTMCIDRLEQGQKPICVMSCDLRALEFGPLEDLVKKYGNLRQLDNMPDPNIAKPAAVFKKQLDRKQIVPYNADKALDLWQGRGPNAPPDAPQVFTTKQDVTNPPDGLIRRNKLVLKAKNIQEMLYWTTHDE